LAQGKAQDAAACYEQALRVRPDYQLALNNLRIALAALGKPGDAIDWNAMVLQHNYVLPFFWGMGDAKTFGDGLMAMLGTTPAAGRFAADNLVVWGRNLSFLDDQPLMDSLKKNGEDVQERALVWRTAVLLWAVRNGLRRDGDFVECGTYKGTTARELCDAIDIGSTDKEFWLYDVFDWSDSDKHLYWKSWGSDLHAKVVGRFKDLPCVRIVKGYVPESFAQGTPSKISFLHLDMNNAPAEIGALDVLWDRVVPGGMVVLDDYGWTPFKPQKVAEDEFFGRRGYSVLELPTGQGIVLK
jgi:hypothetical protein